MHRSDIENILASEYQTEIVKAILDNYLRALSEYQKGNWQYLGNEIGQFIECARRMIEYKLSGRYTQLEKKLTNFNEKELIKWENSSSTIPEEYRIIIPRTLYAMSCIRNKRGMIHKNHIDPNKMDATVLLNNTKWVLAEFFRLATTKTFDETVEIIDSILNKETNIVWDTGNVLRILDIKMSCANQVLCLLYMENKQTDKELLQATEYSNPTNFKKILLGLHKSRDIDYYNSICSISPLGIQKAEQLLKV